MEFTSTVVILLVIQINSRSLFLTTGSKLQQVYTGIQLKSASRVNKYTLSYQFLNGNVHTGVSLLRTAQSLLTGRTIDRGYQNQTLRAH